MTPEMTDEEFNKKVKVALENALHVETESYLVRTESWRERLQRMRKFAEELLANGWENPPDEFGTFVQCFGAFAVETDGPSWRAHSVFTAILQRRGSPRAAEQWLEIAQG